MDMIDLRELIQDDIITCLAGWSNGGDDIKGEHFSDCVTDVCDIVVNRFVEFDNEQKRSAKITNDN